MSCLRHCGSESPPQAELRTLKSTFEKVYHERKALSSELGDSKEYCYKLEIQISRMENSGQLLAESEDLKSEVYRLQHLLEQKQVDVEICEQKYKQLEQEKSSLAHSLEAALSYQQVGHASLPFSGLH
jgi:predicted RNase H-like nuclease (RuvC/YqgF family)